MFEIKNRYKTYILIELHNTMPHYNTHEFCHYKDYEIKSKTKQTTKWQKTKISRQKLNI